MYPGLVGIGDTPKLQFVGSVLGTPHSPGYPLYVWISWAFSRLPIGSVAFRINLLSVICGAAATGVVTLILTELGCRRPVAFAAALAVAFGRLYWSQALLAEVYALNALLFSGVLLFLLRWSRTRALGDLLGSLAWFAAGLAHHLTLAMTAPALLLFALMTDRHVLTRRTVLTAVVICLAGLSCYLFLWLRTIEQAPFLEVRATSFADLAAIVSGRQFAKALFRFSPRELVSVRAPLIAGWLLAELRWAGAILAATGAAWLAVGRRRELVLLGGSAALVTLFALNYDVYDVQVFLIIPIVALGILAGLGAEAAIRAASALPAAAPVATSAVLLLPWVQYRDNVRFNNHHRHTFEARYFDALFDALPDRSAIVAESYPVDHMVLYKLLAEDGARGRRIEIIPADAELVRRYVSKGFIVFAFANGRSELELDIPFVAAELGLPTPRSVRNLADTEAPELAYPLSVAALDADAFEARLAGRSPVSPESSETPEPAEPPEPTTGAFWRPAAGSTRPTRPSRPTDH
jgi:hypothetical protein